MSIILFPLLRIAQVFVVISALLGQTWQTEKWLNKSKLYTILKTQTFKSNLQTLNVKRKYTHTQNYLSSIGNLFLHSYISMHQNCWQSSLSVFIHLTYKKNILYASICTHKFKKKLTVCIFTCFFFSNLCKCPFKCRHSLNIILRLLKKIKLIWFFHEP